MGCHCPVLLVVRVFQICFSLIVLAATADIAHKFADARQLIDSLDQAVHVNPVIAQLIDHVLKTPQRIFLGMFVSVWTILVAFYIVFVSRIRKGKFAPHAAIVCLEILTILFWFLAFVALALFTVEIEPICLLGDGFPVVKAIIKTCIVMKTAAALAALSWFLWLVTCTTVAIQACRSRKKEARTYVTTQGLETGPATQSAVSAPVMGRDYKDDQGVSVRTVEMLPLSRGSNGRL